MKERARLAAEKKKLEKKQSAKANKNPKKKSGKGTKKAPVKNKAPIISKLNSVQNLPDAAAPSDAPVIVQWTRISSESPDLETGNKNEESTARSDPQYIPLLFGHDFSTNKSETNIPVVQEQVSNPAVRMEAPATQSSNSATLDAPQTPQSRSSADLQNKSNRVDVIISPGTCMLQNHCRQCTCSERISCHEVNCFIHIMLQGVAGEMKCTLRTKRYLKTLFSCKDDS